MEKPKAEKLHLCPSVKPACGAELSYITSIDGRRLCRFCIGPEENERKPRVANPAFSRAEIDRAVVRSVHQRLRYATN